MLKRNFITLLLLSAYTIVLGHSIIPHHHHDELHSEEQSSHHHDDHNDNHHENKEDSSFGHDFENYIHSGDLGDIHEQPNSIKLDNSIESAYIISFFEFKINAIESPPPPVRHSNESVSLLQHSLSSKGLRAPPFPLV